ACFALPGERRMEPRARLLARMRARLRTGHRRRAAGREGRVLGDDPAAAPLRARAARARAAAEMAAPALCPDRALGVAGAEQCLRVRRVARRRRVASALRVPGDGGRLDAAAGIPARARPERELAR